MPSSELQLAAAAIALLVSVFLPWWGEDGLTAAETSLFHVWDGSDDPGLLTIGRVMLIVGAGGVATVFWGRAVRYRRHAGDVAVGVAVVWLLATAIFLVSDHNYAAWTTVIADMMTECFAVGPWVVLIAGVRLSLKRWLRPH